MLLKSLLQEYIFECEIKKYTWKTIKSYKNTNLYLINFLEQEYDIVNVEDVLSMHIKQFMMFQTKKGCKESYLTDY
jgi:integrase/recombinase XerD